MPNGNYQLRLTVGAESPDSPGYGPMWIEANGVDRTDTFTVAPGTLERRRIHTTVTDNKLNVAFKSTAAGDLARQRIQRAGSGAANCPFAVRKIKPGQKFTLGATVSSAPIVKVRVGFGSSEQGFQYREMERLDRLAYRTVIPGLANPGQMSYFIEAVDEQGRTVRYPPRKRSDPGRRSS